MKDKILQDINNSLIQKDNTNNSYNNLRILSNRNEPLLITLIDLINNCDEFIFCVAFAKEAATKPLIIPLNNAKQRNVKGKVIFGNKQNFTDPKAIEFFYEYENIDVRFNMNSKLHTKGYFFRKGDIWTLIIGSSNLTMSALKTNEEWNIIINSLNEGQLVEDTLKEFSLIWNESNSVTSIIDKYKSDYKKHKTALKLYNNTIKSIEEVHPNSMQIGALEQLNKARDTNDKALVISATGTGKTYLAAFDVKSVQPKRVLFVVHRENIAKKAMETFQKVIINKSMGLYSGTIKSDAEFIFSTIQTLSKEEHLSKYDVDEFDYIIIDEVHHSGATTYQRILNHFKPKFLLGLTATPERSDGFNIYELFDYNIAYEIRLNEAIENNLIVPFHYFGVSEIEVNGQVIDETIKVSMKEKALNIKEKSTLYGYDGIKVKGLIFIDNVENAIELSKELNLIGYKSIALTSQDNDDVREDMINRLQQDNDDYLDFIITVDIFNEGIDIPGVNQVLLLRPTESVIVYIQQLGRGLRKHYNKEYLVILDFIGNYKRNFLIPVALSGDSSFNVDSLNQFIETGTQFIPGKCTINFEPVAKELILSKIDKKHFKQRRLIQSDYEILKQRLNRLPLLSDFFTNNMLSPEHILSYKDTYHEVLCNIDKDYNEVLSDKELMYLKYLSQEFTPAKRVHEVLILKHLLEDNYSIDNLNKMIEEYLSIHNQFDNTNNAYKHYTKEMFSKENTRSKYDPLIINHKLDGSFIKSYSSNQTFKMFIDDLIVFNLMYVEKYYKQVDESTILLHNNYSRKEAFHMMNLEYNAGYQVGGYKNPKGTNIVMIFIKLDKSSYANEFISDNEITWYALNRELFHKTKGQLETKIALNEMDLKVFVKKENEEQEYYLGDASVSDYAMVYDNDKRMIRYILNIKNKISDKLSKYFNY